MFGTHKLFHKAEKINTVHKESSEHVAYLKRLYQQGKQVSQITAYIWRWVDEEREEYAKQKKAANKLKTYFEHSSRNPKEIGGNLKKLFGADPTNPNDQSEEANLLRAVFYREGLDNTKCIFPIFNQYERGDEDPRFGYLFEITVNAFTGGIEDIDINSPELLKMVIPYPPRPNLGNVTLDKDTLEDWINNRDDTKFFAENHYIPTSCS